MDQARPSDNANKSGKERRAHARHPVSVPVDIMIEGLGLHSAEARDFCAGGLLIAVSPDNPLPTDKSLDNTLCLITLKISGDDFRMRARIVRAEKDTVGVSFVNPDQITLQALQHHAKTDAQPAAQQQTTPAPDDKILCVNSEQLFQVLNVCSTKTKSHIDLLLENFLSNVNDKLLYKAKDENDTQQQNVLFKTLETINNNRNLITTTFNNSINAALDHVQTLKNEDNTTILDENTLSSFELISDEAFNVWLANSKIINKIESEYSQVLGEIECRLSHVYGQPVDRRNNPYGPTLFVSAFESMLEILELDNSAKPTCYDAFRIILTSDSQKIYKEINQVLIEHNILPKLQDVVHARKTERQTADKNTESPSPEQDTKITNANDQKPGVSDAEATKNVKSELAEEVTHAATQQTLYELVGEIRDLQQQLKQPTISNQSPGIEFIPGLGQQAPFAGSHKLPAYSTAEVLDVIGNISMPSRTVSGDGQSLAAFREALSERLQNSDMSDDGKALSQQQERIIDVTENVFTSLLNDLQVAHSVRPWLEQLAIPVMKMSLLDENIFTDKNHIVRNVINKLANLEVLASAEGEEEQAAVRQAFNWVINLVNTEFDGTTKVYTRAAQQLDLLINVQQQSFDKNLKQVVSAAIKEEREKAEPLQDSERIEHTEDEDQWLRTVQRLKENHWVLFEANSDDPKRLKVAWIAPRKGKYVFVNVMGRKDRIITSIELANLFKDGSAVVLDGTDDPAMDRAQYTMLQKLHQQLMYQSSHDELTGLINRREFMNCMTHAREDAQQSNKKHAICYIDIDNFKVINTSYGFDAGDKLLNSVVEEIKSQLNEENVLSRMGPDKFGLLLQDKALDDAVELIEDVLDHLMSYRFEWNDNRMSITLSAGIALITANTEDLADLLQSAESSCGLAKESGGNQIQIFTAGSSRIMRRKKEMEWATKIDRALDENQLFLRCQKIAPTQPHLDQRPHYEILLGISEELGGNASLESFIHAAEQHNRMIAVDRWVIHNAFVWIADNEDAVSDISAFSINLSGQSLNNEGLIEYIYQQVTDTSVPIERVCFEVTETAGVTNLSDAADFIETIKGTGCKFALDDFGTGMSSYSYLKSLPVDYLKIDGVFIKDIANNKNDYAVVKSICEIGHFMEKTVIAEFVQDDNSAKILQDIGVDYLQGYGIDKPHRLDDLLN